MKKSNRVKEEVLKKFEIWKNDQKALGSDLNKHHYFMFQQFLIYILDSYKSKLSKENIVYSCSNASGLLDCEYKYIKPCGFGCNFKQGCAYKLPKTIYKNEKIEGK